MFEQKRFEHMQALLDFEPKSNRIKVLLYDESTRAYYWADIRYLEEQGYELLSTHVYPDDPNQTFGVFKRRIR